MSDRELLDLVDRALFPPEDEVELDEKEFDDSEEEEQEDLR